MPRERPPHPCQRAYGTFRSYILNTLSKPKRSRLFYSIQRTVMAGFLILDAPARWLMDLFDAISGNRGYLAVGTVLAAYLAAFGLIDTKSMQEETRASVERSLFITLVSSGNAASFVAAMKDFGSTQTMPATEHPSLLTFWEWGRTYQPNLVSMWHWALWRLDLCSKKTKDCSLTDNTRLNLSDANLRGADLTYANLTGAANLTQSQLDKACGTDKKLPPGLILNKPCLGKQRSKPQLFGTSSTARASVFPAQKRDQGRTPTRRQRLKETSSGPRRADHLSARGWSACEWLPSPLTPRGGEAAAGSEPSLILRGSVIGRLQPSVR